MLQSEVGTISKGMRNKDVAAEFFESRKKVCQTIKKVKAPAQDRLLNGLIEPCAYIGNLCADVGAGALTNKLPNTQAWQEADATVVGFI